MLKSNFLILSCLSLILVGCQSMPQLESYKNKPQQSLSYLPDAQELPNQVNFQQIEKKEKKPVIALVLGSGGARGYAHIGVIEILEKYNIHPDFIVGTSAGSIVGALYASGKSADELKEIALSLKANDVRDVKLDMKGFFEGKKVEDFINQQVNDTQLQKLKIPMYVVATELQDGKKVVFNYGNTGQAVRASVAIPSMFIPTKIGTDEYVDGGLVSPVPVKTAKDLGADIVIAVDILAQPTHTETSNIWGLFNQNINIMQKHLAQEELKYADIVIQPDLREKVHIFDVSGREETMSVGREATMNKVLELNQIIEKAKYSFVKEQ
ncbi:patatin-like phospholipase family protein [Acinetobacter portensis]|uniref:patatin-like phospholipase family protein n=1 Tax=Acinetobacter portensis TaxID=1839785 RepID=UPI0013D7AB45